ncbi:putative glycosyltransferase EpsD [bioreactor metagenome]|uniref:Putative glycosyltransferase EpsD n=1 Tax=bioreactor metagenome TaxID=1076179 RepID=A0A645GGR7_9ZZZZ
MILSVGELNQNKHHEIIIRALEHIQDVHYAIAGDGELLNQLKELAIKCSVSDRVHFLGFRDDVKQLYKTADIFCLPSYREGLSASVMEAMAAGLPVVCSDIRGNRDLIIPNKGGILVNAEDIQGFKRAINFLSGSADVRRKMSFFNTNYIKKFSLDKIVGKMESIYSGMLCFKTEGGPNR